MESALSSRDPAAVLALVVSAVDTQAATHDAKAARALLSSLVRSLEALLAGFHENHDFILAVTSSVVSCLRDRMVFDAEDLELRTVLWKLRFQDGDLRGSLDDYKRAADVLREASGLLAGRDSLSVQSCAEATIRIAQALLKADDLVAPNAAHDAIKRAQDIVFRKSDAGVPLVHENWILQFKACHAQIKDNNREFLVAARLYTELSRSTQFDEASILDVLLRAVRCVILAPAGHARQRVMATLARDERISLIDPKTRNMLERMFQGRLISSEDAAAYDSTLPVHQRATDKDNFTVFQGAVQEHNVFAASRVYSNITFTALGTLLGLDPRRAEKVAANMVNDKRLSATIDQVDDVLDFADVSATDPAFADLLGMDAAVKAVCLSLNEVVEAL